MLMMLLSSLVKINSYGGMHMDAALMLMMLPLLSGGMSKVHR